MNNEPLGFLEGDRLSSFELWSKAGEYGYGSCNKGRNSDG